MAALVAPAGFLASAATAMCCLGLFGAVSLASAVGGTALTQDATLQPLLGISLAITVAGGAWANRRGQHHPAPLLLTIAASIWIYAALYGPLDEGIGVANASGAHGTHGGHGVSADAMHDTMATTSGPQGGLSAPVLVWIGFALLAVAQLWMVAARRPSTPGRHAARG